MPVDRVEHVDPLEFKTKHDGKTLHLTHYNDVHRGRPVLLVHGASAGRNTFEVGEHQCLINFLRGNGFDVWALDWRASLNRAKVLLDEDPQAEPEVFSFDAGTRDVVDAVNWLYHEDHVRGGDKLGIVAHCVGGAIVSQALATNALSLSRVDHVVITALALFYSVSLDNWFKAQDHILEYLQTKQKLIFHPDPKCDEWEPKFNASYELWKQTPLKHEHCEYEFCHRLGFMIGLPYRPDDIRTIHGPTSNRDRQQTRADEQHLLKEQFGYMPLGTLLHATQNLRRGWAAKFASSIYGESHDETYHYMKPDGFCGRHITLMTGRENNVWHPDSMSRMHEWLANNLGPAEANQYVRRYVLDDFGHQDLYWSTNSQQEVFPKILDGLTR